MLVCSNCGEENPERAKFCLNCGTALEPAAAPGRERKFVTILFADVTGSTGLGERLDPERLKDVMSAYFDAMRAEIQAEGGTVEKFIGDAVMAAFGVPQAHEDDPARALRAALRMRARLGGLNRDLERRFGVTLQARIGVNSGEVLASTAPRPAEGMVTGDAVNVAARLEQAAEPGQVLVSERTARATRGFRFGPVGSLTLKGKGEAVAAVELLAAEEAPERGVPGIRAPMVGRDRELAVLMTLYERAAAEGRPQLVTIYGEPGVGKSRLTAEFLQAVAAHSSPPRQLRGRCLPYGEGITYWPLGEILKQYSGVLDNDPPEEARRKIRETAGAVLTPAVAPEPARATAALAYTVGFEDPEFAFAELAPRQVRAETHAAWRSFLSALAFERPTVVVIEDIHWADRALLDMLEELADRSEGPLLFVCPSRPELTQRRPGWGGGHRNVSSISLDPLSRHDADRLIRFLLTVDDLPATVHETILARAEGNPFFLEEIIRHLIDEGRIVRSGERWRAAAEIEQVVIPDTVQGVLAARIDLLGPDEKRALQSAAVVGRVFWTGPVGRLLNGEADQLEELLRKLEDRDLVLSRLGSSMEGDREFIFKHVLTRDVAYASLPRRDRTSAHIEVARWIEETAADRTREFAELLAYHYLEAYRGGREESFDVDALEAVRSRAGEYLLTAARDARTRFAADASQRLTERALDLAVGPAERGRAYESLGFTALTAYRGDQAWDAFREAVRERLAEDPVDHVAVARLCARAIESPTRWPGSMSHIPPEPEVRRYLDIGFEHVGKDDSTTRLRLLIARSFWPWAFPGEVSGEAAYAEAIGSGEEAAEVAMRMGRLDLASAALDGVGGVHGIRGLAGDMVKNTDRRLDLAQRLEDPFELGDIYATAAWGRVTVGRYREAAEVALQGLERADAAGGATALHMRVWLGLARFRLGEWAVLLDIVGQAEALLGARAEDPPGFAQRLFAATAFVHAARGDQGQADRYVGLMKRLDRDAGGQIRASVVPWLAPAIARRESPAVALALLEEGERVPFRVNHGFLLESRCDLVAEGGAWDMAARVVADTRAYGDFSGIETLAAYADRLEGRAALAGGDPGQGVPILRRAWDGFVGLEARWEAAVTELALAEALLLAGQREEAAELLPGALAVFDELHSVREQERARDLLAELR